MADNLYREDKIRSWQRSKGVTVTNDYNETPMISYQEEVVVTDLADRVISKTDVGVLNADLSDPTVEFPLLDPNTGNVIGTAHYIDLYVLMYSHYMYLASLRDKAASS